MSFCYLSVTGLLLVCYWSVTGLLLVCYWSVTGLLLVGFSNEQMDEVDGHYFCFEVN